MELNFTKEDWRRYAEDLRSKGADLICDLKNRVQGSLSQSLLDLEKRVNASSTVQRLRQEAVIEELIQKSKPLAARIFGAATATNSKKKKTRRRAPAKPRKSTRA